MRRELKELVGAVKDLMGDTSREHVYSQLSSERAKVAQLQARVSFLENEGGRRRVEARSTRRRRCCGPSC
jgi:hypothetical protein